MNFSLLSYILITGFLIYCDWLTLQILTKNFRKNKKKGRLHIILSLISMTLVTYIFVQNSYSLQWNDYRTFQNIMLFVVSLYAIKVIYLLSRRFNHQTAALMKKIPASRHWTDRMNAGKYPVMTRRKFSSQVGIVLASAPVVSLLMGWSKGRFNFQTRRERLTFPNLPKEFDGLRIVHISDLHLGSFNTNHHELASAIEMINAERPHIVCFTGDLVNNFAQETVGWEKVFDKLDAKIGKYSILGNHDYGDYSKWKNDDDYRANFQGIVDAHQRLGFKLLRNNAVTLTKNGESIAIAGVENWGHAPFPQLADLKKATSAFKPETPFSILLTHDPDHWTEEVAGLAQYDLSLAGHTHGMQFGLDYKGLQWSPAKYKFKHWAGLYNLGNQFLYVNRGLGVLGLPARIGMRPEITVLELGRGPITAQTA